MAHDDSTHPDRSAHSARPAAADGTDAPAARRLHRRVIVAAGLGVLLVAVLLGGLIAIRNGIVGVDEGWASEVIELRGAFGDAVAFTMNRLGGGAIGVFVVPLGGAVVLLVCRRPWGAAFFLLASAASAGVVQLLKQLFGRARPEDMLVTSDFGSFPSGHVANAATIAVVVGIIAPRVWVWVLGVAYTVLMAFTRTYLGVHWLTDTIAGALVGAGVALVVWAILARPLERERQRWHRRRDAAADPAPDQAG
ncbi:phosphatase PAP2 family protein [Agromyces mediolanus]|uniref:phosphatase PAP2 family protein n=1 Tax=Agromyces mediolanus TaxID=41986 RepID=UPI00203FF8F2|nr:phosphatase PAP2 family protein [Agromyces mediolanus]MCM3658768.1 phosphatase PAP2 family protein [Agromyces mediolanus]